MADFTKLQKELNSAKSRFSGGADLDADLEAISFALNSVIEHLRDIDTPIVNTWPLLSLMGALQDIRTGGECPLLEPRPRANGRPARPTAYDSFLALASAAIALLIQDEKRSKKDAAKKVARIFENRKYPLPKTNHSESENWKALAEWRDKLLRGEKDEEIRNIYFNAIRWARKHCGDKSATAILEILNDYGGTA